MRIGRRVFVIVAAGLVAAACGGPSTSKDGGDASAPGNGPPTASCVEGTRPACAAPADVATAQAFFDAAAALTEAKDMTVAGSSGAALLPTSDLRVTAALEIDVQLFQQKSPTCPASDAGPATDFPSCIETSFAPEKPFHTSQTPLGVDVRRLGTAYPSGVECAALAVKPADGCARLRVAAGTVLRLQRVVEIDNFGPVSRHYLRVVRACNTPCGSSERFCAASGTCLVDGKDHCLLCEGRKAAVCACRTGCEATSDGATCSFMESDDTGRGGTCHSGTCANP